MVLTYWGPSPTGTQDQTTLAGLGDPTNYLEAHTVAQTTYAMQTVTAAYNDRIATCPYKVTWSDTTTTSICN
jgi:hypothetical protein